MSYELDPWLEEEVPVDSFCERGNCEDVGVSAVVDEEGCAKRDAPRRRGGS